MFARRTRKAVANVCIFSRGRGALARYEGSHEARARR